MTSPSIADRLQVLHGRATRLENAPLPPRHAAADRPLVLCGAGPLCQLTLAHLRRLGREPAAVIDNDPRRWGGVLDGAPILAPADAVRLHGPSASFVVTIYNGSAVRRQLSALGCAHVLHFADLYHGDPDEFLPFCGLDRRRVMLDSWGEAARAAQVWSDARSADEFLAQLEWRLRLGDVEMPAHDAAADTYFPQDLFRFRDDEVFFDCGAFDGDSIRQYLRRRSGGGAQIVAFEPDARTFLALTAFRDALPPEVRGRIRLEQAAVAERTGNVRFAALGSVRSGVDDQGTASTPALALDDLGIAPTFIKMDVEGFELPALEGAAKLLRANEPVLAISLYHHASDLWTIPNFLRRLVPGYRLFLRRYAEDCWESVLYAVPANRLIRPGAP